MRCERAISRVLLVSILVTLLLNINFTIWNVAYYEGDLQDQVRQEMQLLNENGKADSARSDLEKRIYQNFSIDMLSILGILFVFYSFDLLIKSRQPIRVMYPNTLVALSVRLND